MRSRGAHRAGAHRSALRGAGALPFAATAAVAIVIAGSAAAGAFGLAGGPPPTPVPPSGSLSPFPQTLRTPAPSTEAPHPRAAAAILVNARTGQALFAKAPEAERAIASLTKVMTALVAVRARKPSHVVTVRSDATEETGSVLGLEAGERIRVDDLLEALMLQSSNDAATALADDISGSERAFVERMNGRARQLSMLHTRFASASGLDDRGFSTASDLAVLARAAVGDAALVAVMRSRFAVVPNQDGPSRHVQNRNALLWLYPGAFGIKTGYTSEAGNCLIAAASRNGRTLISVVLGDSDDRVFDDAAALLTYGFDAFDRRTVVERGSAVGTVAIQGVSVQAVAGAPLTALVRRDRAREFSIRIEPNPDAILPLAAGMPVGVAIVAARGLELGRVLALAAAPASPPPTPRPPRPRPRLGQPAPASAGPLDLIASLLRATFGAIL